MNAVGSGGAVERRHAALDRIGGVRSTPVRPTGPAGQVTGSFHDVLTERLSRRGRPVKLSAHAGERLRQAGVQVDARFEQRLQSAVDKAAAKGSRSSLVLLDEVALVVSVKNRTVITAVDSARMKENVFTNIDSAVIT